LLNDLKGSEQVPKPGVAVKRQWRESQSVIVIVITNCMPGPFSKKPDDKIPRRISQKSLSSRLHNHKTLLHTQQRMSGTANRYRMSLPPFETWVQKQQIKTPEADRILPLIAQAGPQGISRGEIGRAIKLDRAVLDSFLDGLVRVGLLRLVAVNGIRIYRTV